MPRCPDGRPCRVDALLESSTNPTKLIEDTVDRDLEPPRRLAPDRPEIRPKRHSAGIIQAGSPDTRTMPPS
jgi:hypothetical protein